MRGVMCSVVSDSLRPHGLLARQDPQSVGFSRQECWSGLPFPPPGDLPDPRIEPRSPGLQADSLAAEPQGKPRSPGVGCHFLLQRLFPSQGSSPRLLHWQADSLPSEPPGQPDRYHAVCRMDEYIPGPTSVLSIRLSGEWLPGTCTHRNPL
ncbi:unnamed protein product [Rangifer tarandus platyrhynchus]|uniref:Uncharacterized protein n=1 Tax=Rangifer tarandus platyrhynchus TaxID=3082113 RepID=A0ABN9A375_RANTA|nr:unnamed protein product [Rangifer tarandus platyrhynchus]